MMFPIYWLWLIPIIIDLGIPSMWSTGRGGLSRGPLRDKVERVAAFLRNITCVHVMLTPFVAGVQK